MYKYRGYFPYEINVLNINEKFNSAHLSKYGSGTVCQSVCVCVCVWCWGGHNKRGQNQRGPCSARLTHQASHPTLGIVFSLIRLGLT